MNYVLNLLIFGFLLIPSFNQQPTGAINKTDSENKKQGYWVIKNNSGNLVEEGEYKDNRKYGLWKAYFLNGKIKSEITFVGSRPKGPYKLYFENGLLQEEGNWSSTKNTGQFKRYHSNGKISQEFNFNSSGRREGEQKYYHENGELRIVGTWAQGQESGELKEYYDNGDLKSVKRFANGEMDKEAYEEYAPKKPTASNLNKEIAAAPSVNVKAQKEEQPNQGGFSGNGYFKLYNKDMQITKDGTFKDYRFMEGKMYDYDENGLVVKIKIFKNGRYIGDGVIESE
jgi:antitoxin component YwqK of YwqJK toxin-antitoxin module